MLAGINLNNVVADTPSSHPRFALMTEKQKISSLLNRKHSYSDKWNQKKSLYEWREEVEKKQIARNEMLSSFRQFINASER